MIESIAQNNRLTHLTLAWNILLEEKEQERLNSKREDQNKKLKLTEKNKVVVKNLCSFIKYNPKLIHLNLSNCGLGEASLIKLSKAIRDSLGLKSIHLSGNPGVSEKVI